MSLFSKRRYDPEDAEQTAEPFGTLVGLRHESSGGSMAFHSEFEIEMTDREIVQCAYWPQAHDAEMMRKTHIPLTLEQWENVAQTVRTLWPLFHKAEPKPQLSPSPDVRVLDGGDYSRWFLTRQTADGVRTAQYDQPDDRRIQTLIALLQEIAEPIGREIPRYDPPVLCSVYVSFEKEQCSYQCTPWDSGEEYRFIAYEKVGRERRSIDARVPKTFWKDVDAFLEPLRPERFPAATNRDAAVCTLYFSDGKQKRVAPDTKTCAKLRAGFAGFTDRVRKEYGQKEDQ